MLARIATGDKAPVQKADEFVQVIRESGEQGSYDALRRIADALPGSDVSPIILLVDQFEEIYSLCDAEGERSVFVRNLMEAARDKGGRASVILTLRSDFLGATTHYPDLNRAISGLGSILPVMTADELREAIEEPARRAGQQIDAATVDLLISETEGREGALPLLQFVLSRIWEGMAQGRRQRSRDRPEPWRCGRSAGGRSGAHIPETFWAGQTDRQTIISCAGAPRRRHARYP